MKNPPALIWVVAGAIAVGTIRVGLEPEHVQLRIYEEPALLTYTIANSTATINVTASLVSGEWYPLIEPGA